MKVKYHVRVPFKTDGKWRGEVWDELPDSQQCDLRTFFIEKKLKNLPLVIGAYIRGEREAEAADQGERETVGHRDGERSDDIGLHATEGERLGYFRVVDVTHFVRSRPTLSGPVTVTLGKTEFLFVSSWVKVDNDTDHYNLRVWKMGEYHSKLIGECFRLDAMDAWKQGLGIALYHWT